ncbi:heme-binding protein [Microbacterium sp. X-17]|uniref:heme-degrading domain-containing protein n=1 Tax=Microbacterium sp. X-17 TaxID=3144404 RepID=UPI0031F563C0
MTGTASAENGELDFDQFGHGDAWALGQTIIRLASERSLPIAASIWIGEQHVFHAARPGTSADNDGWLERKAALVRRYDVSSLFTTQRLKELGIREALPVLGLDPRVHVLSGGAVPIRVRGTSVGVAAVSGLTEEDDHALVVEAIQSTISNIAKRREG